MTGEVESRTHVDHVLLVFWQLRLELLSESRPVDIRDLSFGILHLLLHLFDNTLGIVTAVLLDFVNDTLDVLVLEVVQESADTLRAAEAVVQRKGSWWKSSLSDSRERVALPLSALLFLNP